PAVRAASWSFLTFGTVSEQRGRLGQLVFIISRIKSAVVLPSSVTGLSSGTGGAFTVAHSAIMSAATDGDAVSNATASVPATAAAQRKRVCSRFMMSSPDRTVK